VVTDAQRPGRLAGKVAIVTGAGSRAPGIGNGRATAILFAREGARVVLCDRVAEWAEQTLGMIADEHGEAIVVEGDVTRAEDCQRIVDETVKRYGRIDILHNNVGIGGSGTVVDVDLEEWDQIMQVNVRSMMLMARHVIPVMGSGGGGAITNVSSISSIRPRGLTPYTTSKGAVNALTIAMAVDHAAQGIRVNAILPGPVYTPGVASGGMTEEQRAARARASLMGTEGTAWDVGWAAVYLASPEARWVTGQLLCVDGGVTLTSASRAVGAEPQRN
jgi:NAD(P)-dependent dehydrogenase (short-subunit alcohol dehydrogenase family)